MMAVFHRKYSVLIRRLAAVTVPAVLAAPLLVSMPGAAAAAPDPGGAPVVNWALAGQASADSTASGSPAANAIDGDAGTDWCTSAWTGTLTVDLGQVRSLSDLGITLDSSSPSASATIKTAATSGDWQTVPAASNVALDPGNPMYLPLPRGTQARYAEITVYSDTGADVCVGEFRMYGPDPAAAGLDFGTDLSFTPQELAAGARFSYHGQQQSPVTITKENGANYVRMRLWVNPPPGYSDLASDLALARSVHAAGMKIYLDIMYSDFWADPQHQDIPAAWQGQDLAQLTTTVQSYTQQVISAFARQGTPVDLVSIGNEIRNGILWPIGQVNDPSVPADYDNLATLLKAGVAGARAGNPAGHRLLIMMHYDQGGDNSLSQAFFQNLIAEGVPFDVIGLSYYPFFHGTISRHAAERGRAGHPVPQADRDRRDPVPVDAGQREQPDRGQHRQLRLAAQPAVHRLPGQPGRPAVLRHRRAVHPGPGPRRARRRPVLLGAGLDPGGALGTRHRRGHAERQPHPVQLAGRRAAVDRHLPQPGRGVPELRPVGRALRGRWLTARASISAVRCGCITPATHRGRYAPLVG